VKVALDKAEYAVNKYFQNMKSDYRVNLLMCNSKTNPPPQDSLVLIQKPHDNGAIIVVGPATSTAVSVVKEYADKHNITLISYASTSPLLSIVDDKLFS
jgi:ABC-type branched-subunit amino acid transport system substrate-binding protein